MNIVEPILFHCKTQAAVAAMCAPGHALPLVSYGRLQQFIYNIAGHARAQGLGPGNLVALRIEEPILHAAFVLGLAYLGAETVSVRDDNLPGELGIDAVIADTPRVFKNARRVILADMNWLAGDGRPLDQSRPADGACRIVLTSGTTGHPKGVAFSHDMLIERIARQNWTFGGSVAPCACYGSTEANIVATAPAHAIADTPGAVGYVTPGFAFCAHPLAFRVHPRDANGRSLPGTHR